MDADVSRFLKVLFRKGDPAGEGKPAFTAAARWSHSFFGMSAIPDLPPDTDVVTGEDLSIHVSALERSVRYGGSVWPFAQLDGLAEADRGARRQRR